jgi:tryptophan-rich sensory protein
MFYRYGSLAVFLLLVILAAFFGSSFEAGEWYHIKMNKPPWTPPAWLFGPVWAVLYVLMALAAWKVWMTGHYARLGALVWWAIQLVLNVAWSWLFFGLHRPGWAWVEMTVLIAAVLLCIRAFRLISRPAANLMVPYLLWLIFAWVLNLALWTMNGGLFSRVLLGGGG